LIEGISVRRPATGGRPPAAEQHQQQRENDTGEDRRRERKVEREVPAAVRKIAGQSSERHTERDQQTGAGYQQANQNKQTSHRRTQQGLFSD